MGIIYKIDLDLENYNDVVDLLSERLYFCDKIGILPKKSISKVELILKCKYSAKIHFNKVPKSEYNIIIIQAILGDDWKRLGITYRDFELGIKEYNRLFDIKRYPNGSYKYSKRFDITKQVFRKNERKKIIKKPNL
jgi:hypothetical protein